MGYLTKQVAFFVLKTIKNKERKMTSGKASYRQTIGYIYAG